MRELVLKLLGTKKDTTDAVVDKMRLKVEKKEHEVVAMQQKFERTATYYMARAMGAIK